MLIILILLSLSIVLTAMVIRAIDICLDCRNAKAIAADRLRWLEELADWAARRAAQKDFEPEIRALEYDIMMARLYVHGLADYIRRELAKKPVRNLLVAEFLEREERRRNETGHKIRPR